MTVQLAGTLLLAWLVGVTAKSDALLTIVLAVVCFIALKAAGDLFSQKQWPAVVVDGGYLLTMSLIMIVCQGVF